MENTNLENIIDNSDLQKKNIKKVFNRVGIGVLIFLLAQAVFAYLISFVLEAVGSSLLDQSAYFWLSALLSFTFAFFVFWAFLKILPDKMPAEAGFKPVSIPLFLKVVLISFGLMYAVNYITGFLIAALSMVSGKEIANQLEEVLSLDTGFFALAYLVVFGPILEELAFRWLLFKKLAGYGARAYILFSSLLFALFHLTLNQVFYAFVLGLVFSTIMYYTGKIRYSIILHVVANFFGGAVPLLLNKLDDGIVHYIWLGFSLLLTIIGLSLFFKWLKDMRAYKDLKKAVQEGAEHEQLRLNLLKINAGKKHALPLLDFSPKDGGQPQPGLRDMLLNPAIIIFVIIFVVFTVLTSVLAGLT